MRRSVAEQPGANVPHATRSRRPGWRNPRLLLGIVLVAGSVVLGARLLAAADDTVGVWAVVRDLPAGATVQAGDLERRQIRFPDARTADGYVPAGEAPAPAATLNRPVSEGELLPRSAIAEDTSAATIEVPVSVVTDDLPATVQQGSVVDVWVTPKVSAVGEGKARAVPVLTDVVVVAVPRSTEGFAPQTTRQVIVGVPLERGDELSRALGVMSEGRVVVARKG